MKDFYNYFNRIFTFMQAKNFEKPCKCFAKKRLDIGKNGIFTGARPRSAKMVAIGAGLGNKWGYGCPSPVRLLKTGRPHRAHDLILIPNKTAHTLTDVFPLSSPFGGRRLTGSLFSGRRKNASPICLPF